MAKHGVVRTTISIPADLKRQMDKVKSANWSAIAYRAFEVEIGAITQTKEKKTMDDVISRLRASKMANDSELFKEGFAAGSLWAKDFAEASELEHLSAFKELRDSEPVYDWQRFFHDESDSAYTTAEFLHMEIAGLLAGPRRGLRLFRVRRRRRGDRQRCQPRILAWFRRRRD